METPLVKVEKPSQRIDFLSLCAALCVATIPWSLQINTLTIIGFGIGVLAFVFIKNKSLKIKLKPFLIGATIFIVALAWMSITEDYKSGFKYLERSLSALIFPLIFSILFHRYSINKELIFRIFLISCGLRYFAFLGDVLEFELLFIFDYWKEVLIQFNQLCKVHGLHPSYFSLYLGFCSLICFDQFSKSISKKTKIAWIVALLVFVVFNLSLAAKMPIIATLVAMVLSTLVYTVKNSSTQKKRRIGFAISGGFILLLILLIKIPNPISQDINNYYKLMNGEKTEDIYDYNQYGTSSSLKTWEKTNRLHIWNSGLQVFKNNLILGVGTGDIGNELNQKFIDDGHEYLSIKNTNSHNQALDYLIKYGIIGFVIILFAFFKYYAKSLKNVDQLYFMFLVLVSISMLTENILNRQYGIVFFFYLNSLFYFYAPIDSKRKAIQKFN